MGSKKVDYKNPKANKQNGLWEEKIGTPRRPGSKDRRAVPQKGLWKKAPKPQT